MIWKLRIRLARFILGNGPPGQDYYFRGRVLMTRREPIRMYKDWSEVLDVE